jgi:hypothetical protein
VNGPLVLTAPGGAVLAGTNGYWDSPRSLASGLRS